jgi:hypothetical protein
MRKFSLVFLVLSLSVFLITCSKDIDDPGTDPNPDPDPEVVTSITKTIGFNGGLVELGDLELDFPQGIFEGDNQVTVSEYSTYTSGFDNVNSKAYKVEGLPQVINNPITVSIKYDGTLVDEPYLAMGEEILIKSLNKETTAFRLLDATEADGILTGEIPILEPEEGLKVSNSATRGDETIGFNILAVSGYASYKSESGHFKVKFPKAYIEDAYGIADYLESAYTQISDVGFSYQKRTKWPVEVLVKPLGSGVYGYSTNSLWGDNYGWLELNSSLLSNATEVKVTAGHEFFHLVQSFYDPRNRFSKSKFQSDHLWLDEAASVWAEALFKGTANYVSPIFGTNAKSAVLGANTINTDAQSYGYGMAAFIKYITGKNGNRILPDIYDEIANGTSPFNAINKNLSTNTSLIWTTFVKDYLSFDLYNGEGFTPGWLAGNADGTFQIATEKDTVKNFKLKYGDLSAKIFYLKTTYSGFTDDTQIEFETLNGTSSNQIMVFKFNSNKSEFIAESHDTLILSDVKSILDDGYKLAAVVTNDHLSTPYDSEQELELKITVVEKFNFDYADIEVRGTGTYFETKSSADGDTTFTLTNPAVFSLYQDPGIIGQNVNINGRFISLSYSYTNVWNHSYNVNIILNNDSYPTKVLSFDGTYTTSYTDSNTNRVYTTTVSGYDIPLESNNPNNYSFTLFNNIDGNISSFTYTQDDYFGVYTPPTVISRKLTEFDGSTGRVVINFRKKE